MKKFDIGKLSAALMRLQYIKFAYLFGSSNDEIVKDGGDIDIACYYDNPQNMGFDQIAGILKVVDYIAPGVPCDICNLNDASETMRFEALKGHRLFVWKSPHRNLISTHSGSRLVVVYKLINP